MVLRQLDARALRVRPKAHCAMRWRCALHVGSAHGSCDDCVDALSTLADACVEESVKADSMRVR